MSPNSTNAAFVRPGYPRVTPRLVVRDAKALVAFLQRVFGATGEYREDIPSEIAIGDSMLLITEPGARPPTTAFLYVYVNDADATYRVALDAGARALESPTDMPYGDRRGRVEDPWGNVWQIATFQR
jgi:PhnB protein